MIYEEFAEKFIEELKGELQAEDVEIHRHDVTKTNGVVLDGLAIRFPDSPVCPTIYLDGKYALYEHGYSMAEIVEISVREIRQAKESMPKMPVLTKEMAKQSLYLAVVNAADNEEMLTEVPHDKIEDLAVVVRFRIANDASFLVSDSICQRMQLTSSEVLEIAHNNSKEDYKCLTMEELLRESMRKDDMPEEYIDDLVAARMGGKDFPMYILTNEARADGAAAIASPLALKAAQEKLGENYFILPSSRHELILIPESEVSDVKDLSRMVKEVNETSVSRADKLSDHVYYFNGRRLSMVDKEQREQERLERIKIEKGIAFRH